MQRLPSRDEPTRPQLQPPSRSFSRYEAASPQTISADPLDAQAAKSANPDSSPSPQNPQTGPERSHSDVFETQDDADSQKDTDAEAEDTPHEEFASLPIEIRSLVDRFLESLPHKSQSSALSIDQVAELYQNFYLHVQSHIATHIAALQTKLSRERSPAASVSSTSSAASRNTGARRAGRLAAKESDQQMLTASEVADRKKARRQLELKRLWMEEAVERHICERAYGQVWRHNSTDDESRDAKLKSRAAALALVKVDLKELLSTALSPAESTKADEVDGDGTKQDPAYAQLSKARGSLDMMNQVKHPQGKLHALSTTHKEIVDALQQLYPSSSSADEILPTLIYIIITSHPGSLNLVSDLYFTQRFRNANKLGGEAAYCLTNLEAAIGFLETVDLSSIRSSELPGGPNKGVASSSRPSTPRADGAPQDPLYRGLPGSPPQQSQSPGAQQSPRHSRRLSSLIGNKPQPLPGAVITQADNAIEAVHTALDSSFQFLFGRIREKQLSQPAGESPEIVAPKTLEDARKLVSENQDGHGVADEETSVNETHEEQAKVGAASDVLTLIGGRRQRRDPSVGSAQSETSASKKGSASIALAQSTEQKAETGSAVAAPAPGTTSQAMASGYAAVESMRNFGDSLNPFKTFGIRGFGKPGGVPSPPPAAGTVAASRSRGSSDLKQSTIAEDTVKPAGPSEDGKVDLSGIGPPMDRFVEMRDARELNFFDVELLLRDYQRLAGLFRVVQT